MVKVAALSRRFGSLQAVDQVSFEVRPGEVFGLLGPNGAGKTTLIRMLSGVLAPSSGQASVAGFDISSNPDGVKEVIGYATQEASVYRDLTVKENLAFRAELYLSRSKAKIAVDRSIERFGLAPWKNQLAGALSGGWRQRLSLAQAVVHQPKVVFLDEPTTGLDPVARRSVWDLIHSEASLGSAVLVSTHYMDEAERCHRIALVFQGRLLALGSPKELKDLARSKAAFYWSESSFSVDQLKAYPDILEAWPSGGGTRLIVKVDGRLTGLDASPVEPNLEDVFIVLTRGNS